ncbi:hypothetical protein ACLOJK_034698 [Asimina triloba]
MSIALEARRGRIIQGPGLIPGLSPRISIFDPASEPGRSDYAVKPAAADEEEASCSSSSIGRNSSDSRGGGGGGGGQCCSGSDGEDSGEVQSSYKGPLDRMDALEESLPVRRGISKFYNGKSKSFINLADAATAASANDLAKPDNAYNRKRRNVQAMNNYLERNRASLLRSTGSISKRPTNSSRTTLALAVAMNGSESSKSDEHEPQLPPLHPQGKSSMNPSTMNLSPSLWSFSARSFSLSDLQGASSGMIICPTDKQRKFC